jgi:hypothetical protein
VTEFASPQQGSPAPAAPRIPALPASPGAVTAARAAQDAAQDAAQAARDAADVARELAREASGQAAQAGDAVIADLPPLAPLPPGQLTTTTGFPVDPQAIIREAIPIFGMTLTMIVVIFIGWPIARAFARRMDRRNEVGVLRAEELQPQLRQLQESIDTMAVELERISESQRFQAKLLAERALPEGQKRG